MFFWTKRNMMIYCLAAPYFKLFSKFCKKYWIKMFYQIPSKLMLKSRNSSVLRDLSVRKARKLILMWKTRRKDCRTECSFQYKAPSPPSTPPPPCKSTFVYCTQRSRAFFRSWWKWKIVWIIALKVTRADRISESQGLQNIRESSITEY